MNDIIDNVRTNVELAEAPLFWYSSELQVAPQYTTQIKSTIHVAMNK
jgi:hypothetical protein